MADISAILAAQEERERIIMFLGDRLEIELGHRLKWPAWLTTAWAILHPYRFGRATGLADAIIALNNTPHHPQPQEKRT